MKTIFLSLSLSLSLLAQSNGLVRTGETDLTDIFAAQDRLATTFHNGKFISIRFEITAPGTPNTFLYDPAGKQTASYSLSPADATKIRIYSASVGASGLLAAVGVAVDKSGRFATFLAVVPPGKSQASYHSLNPYESQRVAVGEDDSIWITTGRLDEAGGEASPKGDYKVLRKFSKEGKFLGEFMPQSSLKGFLPASGAGGTDITMLIPSEDGVSAYFGGSNKLIEIKAGKITKECSAQLPIHGGEFPLTFGGLAASTGGFLALIEYPTSGNGLFALDCAAGKWRPIISYTAMDPNKMTQLVGISGSRFAYRGTGGSANGVMWAEMPSIAK